MTGVRRYWTNLKEPVLVAVVAVVALVVAVAVLEEVPHLAWEDCFRLGCRS